jgi:hypothetical protein
LNLTYAFCIYREELNIVMLFVANIFEIMEDALLRLSVKTIDF